MGAIKICGMCVDLHQKCAHRMAEAHSEMQEYVKWECLSSSCAETGSVKEPSMTMTGYQKAQLDCEICILCVV